VQAALRVGVQHVPVLLEVLHQRRAMGAPLLGLAQAVELELHPGQAQIAPQRARHQDHLGIDIRPGKAQGLDAHLVELPVAAALRLSWRTSARCRTAACRRRRAANVR
jgi:hypothetical protein